MKIGLGVPAFLLANRSEIADRVGRRLQCEVALHLYARRLVSMGRAAELSGLSRGAFEEAATLAGALRNYGSTDLDADLAFAGS